MNKHLPPPADATELRHRAEKRLKEHRPETGTAPTEADTQRLVQELQVHQIELEMQNEELQKARADMEAGLEKFSDLYDFAPVGYLTLDRDGAILEANLASSTLLGIERARLVKQRLQSSLSTADRLVFAAFLTRVFEGKGRESCELTLLPEGHPPVVVRMDAAAAAAGRECRAVLADITEHKRAEADRLILNKLESTGILAGGIAHDFNNLLTVILLHIDLAQIHVPCDEEVVGHLTLAAKAGWMARHLTNQLITFSSGGAPVRKLTCLSGVIQAFGRSALMGSQVQCDLSLPEDLWPAEVDAGQIGQVIQNMVLNAREAMPEGGVVSVRAENVVLGAHETSSLPPGEYDTELTPQSYQPARY